MSDQRDRNAAPQPPVVSGGDEQRQENTQPAGMVVFSGNGAAISPLSRGKAIAWCVAAGACAGISPILAPLFVGLGYAVLAGEGGARERLLAGVCLIAPAVLCSVLFRLTGIEDAVFSCVVGMVGSHLFVRGKLTPGVACISVAALSALFFAVSEAIARLAGTSLAAQFSAILDLYLEQFSSDSIEVSAALANMRPIVEAIWPTAFVIIAFAGFVLSIAGARVGARRQRIDVGEQVAFELFDLPLWVVGCLIASIAILALSTAVPPYEALLKTAGGTLLCSLRLAFATQGYAVLSWFRRSKGWFGLVGLAITVLAFYFEFNLFVLPIVGVLDVWINLRHLNRGARVTIQEPTDRS